MRIRIKYTLLKRNKKYNYKVYEEERYDVMSGYCYSYCITEYNTDEIIMSSIIDWKDVEEVLNKLKELKDNE